MKETNWTKWSSIAEIISSVAILITLIYLAIQTQQNTATLKSIASQGLQDQVAQVLSIGLTTENFGVIYKGLDTPLELTNEEARRFRNIANIWMNAWQNMYFQEKIESSLISPSGWYQELSNFTQYPGFMLYWERNKYLLDPEFQDFAEREIFTLEPMKVNNLVNWIEE